MWKKKKWEDAKPYQHTGEHKLKWGSLVFSTSKLVNILKDLEYPVVTQGKESVHYSVDKA